MTRNDNIPSRTLYKKPKILPADVVDQSLKMSTEAEDDNHGKGVPWWAAETDVRMMSPVGV